MRRDQACVHLLGSDFVADHMEKFLAGASCHWAGQKQRLDLLQPQWLAQQIHHPTMRNPLLHVDTMQDLGVLSEVSSFILGKIDEVSKLRYVTSEQRYKEHIERLREREQNIASRCAALEEELKRAR